MYVGLLCSNKHSKCIFLIKKIDTKSNCEMVIHFYSIRQVNNKLIFHPYKKGVRRRSFAKTRSMATESFFFHSTTNFVQN